MPVPPDSEPSPEVPDSPLPEPPSEPPPKALSFLPISSCGMYAQLVTEAVSDRNLRSVIVDMCVLSALCSTSVDKPLLLASLSASDISIASFADLSLACTRYAPGIILPDESRYLRCGSRLSSPKVSPTITTPQSPSSSRLPIFRLSFSSAALTETSSASTSARMVEPFWLSAGMTAVADTR